MATQTTAPASSPVSTVPEPDPDTPEWERAQPKYRRCTDAQIDTLYRLRSSIDIAFSSDLGLTRKPKK